jgi:hypothetical protein
MHQLELFEETVLVEITGLEGRTTKYLPPNEAVDFILKCCAASGRWIYLDGRNVSYDRLNTVMLKQAKEIVLATMVVGG